MSPPQKAHGVETEEQVFDKLLAYGNKAMERFSSVVDTTSRVLGGGLGNRLATRLRPMVEFLEANPMAGEQPVRHANRSSSIPGDVAREMQWDLRSVLARPSLFPSGLFQSPAFPTVVAAAHRARSGCPCHVLPESNALSNSVGLRSAPLINSSRRGDF